jgi:hypothetical protein
MFIHSYYDIPEAYLNAYPLACAVLVFALDRLGGTRVLPIDPVRAFAGLFVMVYSVTSLLSAGSHTLFYDWFNKSGLAVAKRRGWGARGYDIYGIFPQEWIPRLSTNAFVWLSIAMIWNFWAAWLGGPAPPAAHFLLAFFVVLLQKSMLFTETTSGMHKPILLPAACWYLACSPQLWTGAVSGPAWPLAMLKAHILSMYFMAGVGKMLVSWGQGHWTWADGTNLQYYLFVSMWARPGAQQCALPRLAWLVRRRWACMLLGWGGLAFEFGCPVALWGGVWTGLVFAVAVQFHYGIFYTQGIDFTGQWVPVLLVFLVDLRPVSFLPIAGLGAPAFELACWFCAALHLAGQLFCAFTMREVTAPDSSGGIPFSCMHMFTVNSNIFGDDMTSWYTLQSGDQRSCGHLGIMEWSGPIFSGFNMSKEDMMKLPFKVIWFGHTMNKHEFLDSIMIDEYKQKRFLLFSNFQAGPELKAALQQVCRLVESRTDEDNISDVDVLDELLAAQKRASDAFFRDITHQAKRNVLLLRGASFLGDVGGDDDDDLGSGTGSGSGGEQSAVGAIERVLKLERQASAKTPKKQA